MFYIEWVLSEEEPLEDMLRRFDPGGRIYAMTKAAQVCEIRNIIGKTISKDEESSARCRICHQSLY